MGKVGRLEIIRDRIRKEKKVVVSELSTEFGVTEETIRRDLEALEQEGLVARTYGGAVLLESTVSENIDYLRRAQTNREEKITIGKLAADCISGRVAIGADASSTVMEAVLQLKDRQDITVLTNSIKIIRELDQSSLRLISTGGVVNKSTFSMQGTITSKNLQEYFVDVALISCKALGTKGGVFDSNEEEAEIKKLLVQRAQKVYLLVDHTKFGKIAFVQLLNLDSIDTVITDQKPNKEWISMFEEKGIRLIYPE